MAQHRFFEFRADDLTADLNRSLLGLIEPGVYRGFGLEALPNNTLRLTPTGTGANPGRVFDSETPANEIVFSLWVTRQGNKIWEDGNIELPITPTGTLPRIDAVIGQHTYVPVEGGAEAIYSVIQGTPGAVPVAPEIPADAVQIGALYLPPSCDRINAPGVVWTVGPVKKFGNQNTESITSPRGTIAVEQSAAGTTIDFNVKTASPEDLDGLARTGFYFRDVVESGQTGYPEEAAGFITVLCRENQNEVIQIFTPIDPENPREYYRKSDDFGVTWSAWFDTETGYVSPNDTVTVSAAVVTVSGKKKRVVNLSANTANLGDFLQTTPNGAVSVKWWIDGAVPEAENPFAVIRRPGNYYCRVGTGSGNVLVGVNFTCALSYDGVSNLYRCLYTFSIPGFPPEYAVASFGPTVGALRTGAEFVHWRHAGAITVFLGSSTVTAFRYGDRVVFDGVLNLAAGTDLASAVLAISTNKFVNPLFHHPSGATPLGIQRGGPDGVKIQVAEHTGAVLRDGWLRWVAAGSPGVFNLFLKVGGWTVVPAGGATFYFDGVNYQHQF